MELLLSFTFDSPETIEKIRAKYKIEYPVISISQNSCVTLNFRSGFPTNFISDKNGKVAYYNMGRITHAYPVLEKMLKKDE